jgi:uncharacterized membrane protein YkvA (DUF1232 family)
MHMNWDRIKKYGRRASKELQAVVEASFLTFKDPRISMQHKALLIGSLIYFLSPLDGIPDFLPSGFVDDMSVLLAAIYSTGSIGKHHLKECRIKYGVIGSPEEENK